MYNQNRILAVERFSRAEGIDLFCSQRCCSAIYAVETPEVFTEDELYEKTGMKLPGRVCFYCGDELSILSPAY